MSSSATVPAVRPGAPAGEAGWVGEIPGLVDTAWGMKEFCARPRHPKLSGGDLNVEVAVVGAGIAGLSVAYDLAKAGKRVAVIEARTIGEQTCLPVACLLPSLTVTPTSLTCVPSMHSGSGQTGRTTAHLMGWNDDYYHMIKSVKKFGVEKTSLVAAAHKEFVDKIEEVVTTEDIDCEFVRLPGYLIQDQESPSNYKKIEEELIACHEVGWREYLAGLADAIKKYGGEIFELSRVTEYHGTKLLVNDDVKVTAEHVVLATNSPINCDLAVHARQPAQRSYVVGIKVPKDSIAKALWWDTAEPYHYVRTCPHSETHDVVLVGGEDHPAGEKYNAANFDALYKYANGKWPSTRGADVIYKWEGMVYEPVDMLHLIGREPVDTTGKVWIATGDSGEGMTMGTIAGMLLSDLILGKPNKWSDVYNPRRSPVHAQASAIVEPIVETLKGYAKVVLPRATEGMVDLQPDDGRVVQHNVHKVAVYRDPQGQLHHFTALCTHMGCLVEWNPISKEFDCPCHGSSFDKYGRVINGPAVRDLKKYDW
eukprot:jgi/Chlat1/354/Chrsp10S01475